MTSTIKVEIPNEVNNYIEALFVKDNYLKGLLFLLLSQEDIKEEDIDYYLQKTIISSIELEIAKEDMYYTFCPDPSYKNFYMDFENKLVKFYKK